MKPGLLSFDAALAALLADAELRSRMGAAAREQVRRQQGATARTLDAIDAVASIPVRRAA